MKINIKVLNLLFGIIGLTIIWLSTHSVLGLLGGVISGLHISINAKQIY